jgi:hypothetical protein
MRRHRAGVKCPNVLARLNTEVEEVQLAEFRLNLACHGAAVTEARQASMEAA